MKRERKEASCTYCGVFRRTLLNRTARRIGANKLATGHNLDDEAQVVMMNVMNGDMERLARLRPSRVQEELVPRIKPLIDVPEREIALYAFLRKIPFYMGECPYARESLRGEIKDIMNDFESASGHEVFRHGRLREYGRLPEGEVSPGAADEMRDLRRAGD